MSLYLILLHVHSVLRWLIAILLVYSLVVSFVRWRSASELNKTDSLFTSFTVHFSHLQLLIGLILYFISPKVMFNGDAMASPMIRFFTVEHIMLMVLAIACLTIGNMRAKRITNPSSKAKTIFAWFLIAFILIMAGVPWPFRELGSGWM